MRRIQPELRPRLLRSIAKEKPPPVRGKGRGTGGATQACRAGKGRDATKAR
jgi:hypothetical protein